MYEKAVLNPLKSQVTQSDSKVKGSLLVSSQCRSKGPRKPDMFQLLCQG